MAGGTGEPFYDEKFRVLPGDYQPVVVPLVGRSRVSLRMTMATERAATADRRLKCIVPMLFER
jgi:hypothetical protein